MAKQATAAGFRGIRWNEAARPVDGALRWRID
jgi:hypothetical protein